jgi:Leishmanolysin
MLKTVLSGAATLCKYQEGGDFARTLKKGVCSSLFDITTDRRYEKDWEPIRIEAYTDDLELYISNETLLTSLTTELIPEVVEYFGDILKVKRSKAPLTFKCASKDKCDQVQHCSMFDTPAKYLELNCTDPDTCTGGDGADADLLIMFTAASCGPGASIAWSRPCQIVDCERPGFGQVNICLGLFETLDKPFQKAILVHEITHILGFNRISFEVTGYVNGSPLLDWFEQYTLKPCSTVCKYFPAMFACPTCVPRIVSPNVVREARAFFDCDTLNSVELFSRDGGSHWSMSILQDDSMDPTGARHALLSNLTLALLQDTGMYQPDYSMAEKAIDGVTHGYKRGCAFALGVPFAIQPASISTTSTTATPEKVEP